MSETTFMKLLTLMLLLSSTYYSRVLDDFLRRSTVTTGSPWRSPEGTFGFGFVMPESSSTRNFNLAIWYDIDPKKTVVWMAMANGQLVQVSENAKLELKAEGGLSVTDGSSSAPLWQTNPGQCCAESASLLENGNLVVLGKDKKVAWQSFDSPTNNLLPEQQLRTQGNPSLGYAGLISQSGACLFSTVVRCCSRT
ncbi:G-type lectin S-receptor-like serine/threonine-protein kinase LECRK1 [Selaginella moellendorffii]|uniref:G-type lectin S-receptor-like serine/threonine-protein kinase LECRK1 n=1 Tax=Selaginella moellendorffii TaxID=88036 RepID=UPI000D1C5AD0|nr:G-type lectin S-receptor-like serine/threonine-protein kinase LECRK1 [Selaginella moellendorffii]|eukprot:XP_024524804.1 G-type lectin S-receptor-like serine/threonine-protein kinase LECRK1 [Selaginella moellendorffii]